MHQDISGGTLSMNSASTMEVVPLPVKASPTGMHKNMLGGLANVNGSQILFEQLDIAQTAMLARAGQSFS